MRLQKRGFQTSLVQNERYPIGPVQNGRVGVAKVFACALALALGAAFAPTESQAGEVIIGVAPPRPHVEIVPAARVGYVWSPGYWRWNGGRHVWVGGYWLRERPGWRWAPAHWVAYGPRWHYVPGYWVR